MAREQELAAEARALETAQAAQARQDIELAAHLDRIRREAHATRDAMTAVTSAEESKSQGVRDHELAKLVAEQVGAALAALPMHEAKWITIGQDSPAASIAGLIGATRELLSGASHKADAGPTMGQ